MGMNIGLGELCVLFHRSKMLGPIRDLFVLVLLLDMIRLGADMILYQNILLLLVIVRISKFAG